MNSPNIKVSGFDNTKKGNNTIVVTYQGKTTSFDINIVSKEKKSIEKIKIVKVPNKTKYTQNKEKLDLTGGTINVYYSDGSSEIVKMNSSNVKVYGFDNSKVGINKLTVEYLGKTSTFEVSIKKRDVKKVEVVEKPNHIIYSEDELEISGGNIQVEYTDGSKEEVTFDSPNVNISDVEISSLEEEKDKVFVNYGGIKTSIEVKITKLFSFFDEFVEEDDDFNQDYSEYGEFYEAIKMKPNEVITSIVVILGISIGLYLMIRKKSNI